MAMKSSSVSLAMVIFSWLFLGFCHGQVGGNPPCVQNLLPCQPYLHSATPPSTCCVPLKQVVEKDIKCLCDVFNNPAILKGLNVTQDDALKLAKTCGANADTSLCKTADSPTVSPATPTTSNSSSSNSTATASAPAASAATSVVSHRGGSLSVAMFLSLIFSAF